MSITHDYTTSASGASRALCFANRETDITLRHAIRTAVAAGAALILIGLYISSRSYGVVGADHAILVGLTAIACGAMAWVGAAVIGAIRAACGPAAAASGPIGQMATDGAATRDAVLALGDLIVERLDGIATKEDQVLTKEEQILRGFRGIATAMEDDLRPRRSRDN